MHRDALSPKERGMESSDNYVRCEIPGVIDCYTTWEVGEELLKIVSKINDSSAEKSSTKIIEWIIKYPVYINSCFFINGDDPNNPDDPGGSPIKTKNKKNDFHSIEEAKKIIWLMESLESLNAANLRIFFTGKNKTEPKSLLHLRYYKFKNRFIGKSPLSLISLSAIPLFLIISNIDRFFEIKKLDSDYVHDSFCPYFFSWRRQS